MLYIQWSPSYCGIAQNDANDLAAKDGPTGVHHPEIKISFSRGDSGWLTSLIATDVKTLLWANPAYHYKWLHNIDPHLEFEMPTGLAHRHTTVLHRLRLDVAYTRLNFHRCVFTDSPLCATCNTTEDVEHHLCYCPIYDKERASLGASLSILIRQTLTVK